MCFSNFSFFSFLSYRRAQWDFQSDANFVLFLTSCAGNEIGFAVFACGSADGVALKPMILRDENLLLEHWFTERKEEVVVGHNITGSLDAEALTLYLKRELVPHLQSLDPPVEKVQTVSRLCGNCLTFGDRFSSLFSIQSTLFLDGRWSHAYNLEILECCLLVGVCWAKLNIAD